MGHLLDKMMIYQFSILLMFIVSNGDHINCNSSIQGILDSWNETNNYTFTVEPLTAIYLTTCNPVTSYDTILTVYNSNNDLIEISNSSINCDNKASIDLVNMTEGKYTLQISGSDNYKIEMYCNLIIESDCKRIYEYPMDICWKITPTQTANIYSRKYECLQQQPWELIYNNSASCAGNASSIELVDPVPEDYNYDCDSNTTCKYVSFTMRNYDNLDCDSNGTGPDEFIGAFVIDVCISTESDGSYKVLCTDDSIVWERYPDQTCGSTSHQSINLVKGICNAEFPESGTVYLESVSCPMSVDKEADKDEWNWLYWVVSSIVIMSLIVGIVLWRKCKPSRQQYDIESNELSKLSGMLNK